MTETRTLGAATSRKPSYPPIAPYLLYEDSAAALDWLSRAFGFRERLRLPDPSGAVSHAEMELNGGLIMLGQPGGSYESPSRHGHVSVLVHVYVDDVDAHCERARGAGAKILREPEDQPYGERSYVAEDPEGQRWSFSQHTGDVAPEEWGAITS